MGWSPLKSYYHIVSYIGIKRQVNTKLYTKLTLSKLTPTAAEHQPTVTKAFDFLMVAQKDSS